MLTSMLLLMLAPQDRATANDPDLKCMALFSAMASQGPKEEQSGMVSGVMYFYGKIQGRTPAFDIDAAMLRLLKADPQGKTIEAARERCLEEMKKAGTDLIGMGKRISAAAGQ